MINNHKQGMVKFIIPIKTQFITTYIKCRKLKIKINTTQ